MLNFHNLPTDKQSYSTYPLSVAKLDGRGEKRREVRVRVEGEKSQAILTDDVQE